MRRSIALSVAALAGCGTTKHVSQAELPSLLERARHERSSRIRIGELTAPGPAVSLLGPLGPLRVRVRRGGTVVVREFLPSEARTVEFPGWTAAILVGPFAGAALGYGIGLLTQPSTPDTGYSRVSDEMGDFLITAVLATTGLVVGSVLAGGETYVIDTRRGGSSR